jgi:polar amino acid transport system permease protein
LLPRKTRLTALDLILILLLGVGLFALATKIRSGLEYTWNWSVIPQFLFRFDPETDSWHANLLIQGLLTTIRLSIWATLLAMVLGIGAGLLRTSASLYRRMLGRTYVELCRNLPPLVLVFIFYFFLSDQIMPLLGLRDMLRDASPAMRGATEFLFAPPERIESFLTAVVTLALYEGAYITEIVRAGIESIHKGQWEAAYSLGLSKWQQMRHIILPQAMKKSIPPMAGQFISTIKDSAIVSVISIQELTFQGMELMAATYLTFEVWITVTILYLLLTLTCSLLARKLELTLRRGE